MKARNCAIALALSLGATAVSAAINIHMVIPGVPGESAAQGYEGSIDVFSMSVNVAERSCAGFYLTKRLDKSSPILSAAAIVGSVYPTVTVSVVNLSGGGSRFEFLTYTLANAAVKSVSQGGSAFGGEFTEQVSLFPDVITITYRQQNPDGSPSGPPPVQFSIPCPKTK